MPLMFARIKALVECHRVFIAKKSKVLFFLLPLTFPYSNHFSWLQDSDPCLL